MKIVLREGTRLKQESLYGFMSFASFQRIISKMVKAGELPLLEGEYVSGITIEERGLTFQIESK